MYKRIGWLVFSILTLFSINNAYSQQDVDFHLNAHLLSGQKILKVKRDFNDVYLWVLGQNNSVYRINSLSLIIEDYTAKFAAYNNLKFVDIMGHSADTVFIATNSAILIESANGNVRVFGSADGIPGIVNSVGIDLGWNLDEGATRNDMIIGTSSGVRTFSVKSQTLSVPPDGTWAAASSIADSRVYESTYRAETYKDSTAFDLSGWSSDTLKYLPVAFNTAGIYQTNSTFYVGYIWNGSNTFGNNIYTALGLNNAIGANANGYFGNYFWGTEKGLFQNQASYSYYNEAGTWSHYLDGIKVNKITDIMGLTSFSNYYDSPLIKQNLLVGTDNGFYFSNSVYTEFYPLQPTLFHDDELSNTVINDICVNAVPDAQPICENGVWLAANDGLYLLKPDYGAYLSTQQQKLISFSNQPDTLSQMQVCGSSAVLATVSGSYNSIQWYKDGAELPAQSKDTLAITAAGDYYAVIYDPCEVLHIESNHLKVSLIAGGPVFTFNYPPKLQYCDGTSTTLNVTYSPSYHYQWYTNDVLNGDTTASFIVTQTGNYRVDVSACAGSWVPSQQVAVDFIQLPVPVITADKPAYCMGDNATFSINVPPDTNYTINWYKDNVLLANNTNQNTITTNVTGNYTVSVVYNSANTDGTTCSQTSPAQSFTFDAPPIISIEKIIKTTLCQGQSIDLLAQYSGGTIKWSTGETTDQITVTAPGNYTATVSSAAGCQADTSITIAFFPNPILSVNDTSVCTYKKQVVTLAAPSGYTLYSWNGQDGGQTYQVSQPQMVNLMVTDVNGCQASQQIKVVDECPNIYIHNAFTPNGDGINDTWVIEGLDSDLTATVKVFTRYGTLIFNSNGYGTPWNGEYNNKKLPVGVYYYVITAKNGTQKFSGALTIIY
jgi:gliding motility-associated-like protein